MNCNAAVVSSLLLPSVRPSFLPSFLHGPSTKKNDFSSSSCNNDAISYWKYSCCRNWIGERKKVRSGQWEPAAAGRHPHKDVGTKGREKKKPRETTKKIPTLSSFLHPMQLGFLVRWIRVLLRTTRMLKTRSDIQKEKPNKTQRTKNQPKKKKNHQLLSRHEWNQACSTNPIPSSTNKNKRGKKKCSSWNEKEQEEEAEKLETIKKRSSWSARPFRRLQSSLLITALISCKSSCVSA